jgi:hypothetical protein
VSAEQALVSFVNECVVEGGRKDGSEGCGVVDMKCVCKNGCGVNKCPWA